MSIGSNIKKRRLELQLTLEDVAKRIGTSKQTIQRYEQGIISNIPSGKIEALADALLTYPSCLMGWNINPISADTKCSVISIEKEIIPMAIDKRITTISERIKEGLTLRQMRQSELARITGIRKSSICEYVSGQCQPKQYNFYKIAQALNVSEAWLMGFDVPMQIQSNVIDSQNSSNDKLICENIIVLNMFSCLNADGQNKVIEYMSDLINSGNYDTRHYRRKIKW